MYPLRDFTSFSEVSNIKSFTYKVEDTPFLSTVAVERFFKFLHVYIPESITPNQVTWFGGISIISSLLLTIRFDPSLRSKGKYLPLINFFLLLFYFSADFMDGMHARRTNQCSSLGSILDHGIDSIAVTAIVVSVASSLKIGISKIILAWAYNCFIAFYMSGLYLKYVGLFKYSILAGESRGLLFAMFIHLFSFFAPRTLEKAKKLVNSKYIAFTCEKPFLTLFSAAHTIATIIDLFYNMLIVQEKKLSKEIFISLFELATLLVLLCSSLKDINSSNVLNFHISLITFSLSFTVCYLEEYMSILTKGNQDIVAFIVSYGLVGLSNLSKTLKSSRAPFKIIFTFSIIHFLLRVGSILKNLARALNVKLGF